MPSAGEENTDKEEDNRAAYRGVGDVKRPPAIQMISEKVDIKEIHVKKVNHFAQPDPINNIADSTAGSEGQRVGNAGRVSVDEKVVQNEDEYQN